MQRTAANTASSANAAFTPGTTSPSRLHLLAFVVAVLAAFILTLVVVGGAWAAEFDTMTTLPRQSTVTVEQPSQGDVDLSNQPLESTDNPENT